MKIEGRKVIFCLLRCWRIQASGAWTYSPQVHKPLWGLIGAHVIGDTLLGVWALSTVIALIVQGHELLAVGVALLVAFALSAVLPTTSPPAPRGEMPMQHMDEYDYVAAFAKLSQINIDVRYTD